MKPAMKYYFVKGAPCILTENVKGYVKKGLVNGRRATMVSLTWNETDKSHATIRKLYKGTLKGGVEYEVPLPESVNVEISKKDKEGNIIWSRLVPIQCISSGIKIPLGLQRRWKLTKHLNVRMIHIDLGFAYQRLIHIRRPVGVNTWTRYTCLTERY